jgi:hypothetical protein
MDSLFGFTTGEEIRAHLARGGTQPWQSLDLRRSASAVAKDLAEDLVEIEPLGDGWLFAGRFDRTGEDVSPAGAPVPPWTTYQSITGFKTPAYIFWDDLDQTRQFAKTVAEWADWSKPETGNRFLYGPCRDYRRLACAAKTARDPDWRYARPAQMATVAQVTAVMMIEDDHRWDLSGGQWNSRWRRHTKNELGRMTRDDLQTYLEELVDAVIALKGEQTRTKIVERLESANRVARMTGLESPVWGHHD